MNNNDSSSERQVENTRGDDRPQRPQRPQRPRPSEEEMMERKNLTKEKVMERKKELESGHENWNVRFKDFKEASITIGDELKNFLVNFDLTTLSMDDENKKLLQKSILSIVESESLKQWISTQLIRSLGQSSGKQKLNQQVGKDDISNNILRNKRVEAREKLGNKEGNRRTRINPRTHEEMGDRLKNQQRIASNRNGLPSRKPNRPNVKKPDGLKNRPTYNRTIDKSKMNKGGVKRKPNTQKRYDVEGNPIDNQW